MKQLFELVTEFIEISGNYTVDTILLLIIGSISFLIAFGIVGMLFDFLGYYDSDLMSDCHWIIRLVVFLGLSFVFTALVKFVTWLLSFEWWVYVIIFIVVILIVFLIYLIIYKYNKNKNQENIVFEKKEEDIINIDNIESDKNTVTQKNEYSYSKDYCPRCGGKLVKRHGPYGDFYGCSNFSSKNCRYTRKHK